MHSTPAEVHCWHGPGGWGESIELGWAEGVGRHLIFFTLQFRQAAYARTLERSGAESAGGGEVESRGSRLAGGGWIECDCGCEAEEEEGRGSLGFLFCEGR